MKRLYQIPAFFFFCVPITILTLVLLESYYIIQTVKKHVLLNPDNSMRLADGLHLRFMLGPYIP
jgi:hypothetical protein